MYQQCYLFVSGTSRFFLAAFLSFNEILVCGQLRLNAGFVINFTNTEYFFCFSFNFSDSYVVPELPLTTAVYSLPLSYSLLLQHGSVDPGTNYCVEKAEDDEAYSVAIVFQ